MRLVVAIYLITSENYITIILSIILKPTSGCPCNSLITFDIRPAIIDKLLPTSNITINEYFSDKR